MSIFDHITTQQENDNAATVVRSAVSNGLGWAVGQLYRNDGGVSTPADLRHVGNLAEEIARSSVSEERQGKHLGRLAVGVARQLGVSSFNDKHPDRALVDDLFEIGKRREYQHQGYHVAESDETWAFHALMVAAMKALAIGVTPEEIDANPQMLVEQARRYASFVDRPVRIEHAQATLRGIARWGSICDWISPETVDRLRKQLRYRPPAVERAARSAGVAN